MEAKTITDLKNRLHDIDMEILELQAEKVAIYQEIGKLECEENGTI